MEKLLQASDITQIELLSYFSSEIFCMLGVIINIFMFLFLSRKYNIKRLSDLVTFGVFALNSLICFGIFLKNRITFEEFNFSLLNQNVVLNDTIFALKALMYLFFACFVLCTYKLTRKAKFKGTIVNSSLLLCGLSGSILLNMQNALASFLFFDLTSLFIYKFASNARIRKYDTYSLDFVLMSVASTILFYSFYFLSFFVKEEIQLAIIQVCAACALLLKAGLFPIYNYILNKHIKNLAYSVLLFSFLPYMGLLTFIKFSQSINIANKIFSITLFSFALLIILTSTLSAVKTKNLIKYFANIAQINCSFYLIGILFAQNNELCIDSIFISMFAIFAIYSLITILKVNLKPEKLNISLLQGLFVKNRLFCILFALIILFATCTLPSALFFNNLELLKGIYVFDKIGSIFIIVCLLSNISLILKSLSLIKICYTKKVFMKTTTQLTKRTTPNYVVPIVVIFLLILMMFL